MSWAIEEKGDSQRRACGLIGLELKTYRYASTRGDDAAVRVRLRSWAGERRRFGYRRLLILLRREGLLLNHKKLFRLQMLRQRRADRARSAGLRIGLFCAWAARAFDHSSVRKERSRGQTRLGASATLSRLPRMASKSMRRLAHQTE